VAIPHVHGYTHRVSKPAEERGIRVVGTYRNKLRNLPKKVQNMRQDKKCKSNCDEKHDSKVFACDKTMYIILSYLVESATLANRRGVLT